MLRDTANRESASSTANITVASGTAVTTLFAFVDKNIPGFRAYYLKYKDSQTENRISDLLATYFDACLAKEDSGFTPYRFVKNPTQEDSTRESDIGVRVHTNAHPLTTIAEFEAKRLSETSANKEYVSGIRGGMERFKRGHHARHLALCGMFGYVQSRTAADWTTSINNWIQELADADADSTIDWKPTPEKLTQFASEKSIDKWRSQNDRKGEKPIVIYHYFVNLC